MHQTNSSIQQESIYAFQLQQYITKHYGTDVIFRRIFSGNSEQDYFNYSKFIEEYSEFYPDCKIIYSGNFFIPERMNRKSIEDVIRIHTDKKNPFMLNSDYALENESHQHSNLNSNEFLRAYSRIIPYSSIIELAHGIFICFQRITHADASDDSDLHEHAQLYTRNFEFFIKNDIIDSEIYVLEQFMRRFIGMSIKKSANAFIVGHDNSGYTMTPFTIDISKDFCADEKIFNLIYGDGFYNFSQKIIERLNPDNSKTTGPGIILLHGLPGTGKSTYIRYIIRELENLYNRRSVFMTAEFFCSHINNPSFINFFLEENKDNVAPVLIIEDAESIVRSRNNSVSEGAVSALLNMADGLLRDALSVQIIATFNTELNNIDSALLREGRLLARKQFKKLSKNRAVEILNTITPSETENKKLIEQINNKVDSNGQISISEIFSSIRNTEPLIHDVEESKGIKKIVFIE